MMSKQKKCHTGSLTHRLFIQLIWTYHGDVYGCKIQSSDSVLI